MGHRGSAQAGLCGPARKDCSSAAVPPFRGVAPPERSGLVLAASRISHRRSAPPPQPVGRLAAGRDHPCQRPVSVCGLRTGDPRSHPWSRRRTLAGCTRATRLPRRPAAARARHPTAACRPSRGWFAALRGCRRSCGTDRAPRRAAERQRRVRGTAAQGPTRDRDGRPQATAQSVRPCCGRRQRKIDCPPHRPPPGRLRRTAGWYSRRPVCGTVGSTLVDHDQAQIAGALIRNPGVGQIIIHRARHHPAVDQKDIAGATADHAI